MDAEIERVRQELRRRLFSVPNDARPPGVLGGWPFHARHSARSRGSLVDTPGPVAFTRLDELGVNPNSLRCTMTWADSSLIAPNIRRPSFVRARPINAPPGIDCFFSLAFL